MALALLIWLCTLPLIFIFATPFLGWQIAGSIALGLLIILLPICWIICIFKVTNCDEAIMKGGDGQWQSK